MTTKDDNQVQDRGKRSTTQAELSSGPTTEPPSKVFAKLDNNQDTTRTRPESAVPVTQDSPSLLRWQNRLLPLMSILLVALTIFFLGASIYQLFGLQENIVSSPKTSFDKEIEALRPVAGDLPSNTFEKARFATLVRLEANAVERRYHQASMLVLARVWTIYLGFLTGMILSLVGAAFILGKIRESDHHLDIGGLEWKAAVRSSSPGLILAILGSVLMIVTILAHVEVNVDDRPLYVTDLGVISTPTPSDLGEKDETSHGNQSVNPKQRRQTGNDEENLKSAASKLGTTSAATPTPNP